MSKKRRPSLFGKSLRRREHGRRSARSLRPFAFETLEARNLLAVTTFQHNVGGYTGGQDTVLYSITPNVNFGADTGVSVDQQDVGGVRQGLLRFDSIFGTGPGQIPLGSTINSATITFSIFNDSNASMQMSFYRMLVGWDQNTATWNSFGAIGGVQASEGEATALPPDGIQFDATTGVKVIDVAASLKHWASGEDNLGWLVESAATNGWDFNTSEAAAENRPLLSVNYTPPSGAGQVQFLSLTPSHAEGDAGSSTATLQISRLGGSTGAASVDFTVAAGGSNPATAGADFVAAGPTTVNFAAGETVKEIQVAINGDIALEGLETLTVTLSGATGGATINNAANVATLTIGDDDALINEVVANISNATVDETDREYIELIGAPGASLNGYYFVAFEGNEAENSGAGSGIADLVIDLTGQTFGTNGLLVITPTSWAFQAQKDAATNQFATARLDGIGGRIEDSSQTYALVKSATALVEGTDYDKVGAFLSVAATASSSDDLGGVKEGVGILDTGPFAPGGGAQLVDSVGIVRGGGNDRDRVLTTREAGHPGIHVHQPDGLGGSDLASDGVTRRLGQKTPNSIGVWFNGDIPDAGSVPIAYALGTTRVSVVMPGGGVITPGSANILRNVALTVTAKDVDESAGTVSLTVQRSGDTTQAITVNYNTVDGTAKAGLDYTATSGILNFGVGVSSQDIVVPILTDQVAEGFERFNVAITGTTSPFLVTVGSSTITINDGNVTVKSFQNDVDGYAGTDDTYLNSIQPNDPFGSGSTVIVDEQAGALTGADARPSQGLLRFQDVFGGALNQIPVGAQVFGGFLTLNVLNPTGADAQVRLFRMLQNWDEGSATWSDPQGSAGSALTNGVTPNDLESSAEADSVVTLPGAAGLVEIPLNRDTLQAWANGSLDNFGWSIVSNSGNDWSFGSSDDFLSIDPFFPKLTILYTDPLATAGSFGFSNTDYKVNEDGTASLTVQRIGGSSGAVAVNYEIAAGTGSLADISGSATGTLNFAAGELFKTFTVPIVNDGALEPNETLNVTLSGAGVTFDPEKSAATLTIRDNDFNPIAPAVLLSEIFINSPGLDSGQEFIELAGTPGAGLGSLYLVVINGDVGEGEGSTDLVVDLGAYANGSNGTTLITSLNNFGFRVPSGTTQVGLEVLDNEVVANDTATYALIYSPSTSLHVGAYDYDWDNDGSLDLPTNAVIVDSIGNKDNGTLDQTYGPAANVINSQLHLPSLYVADAISRNRGNTARNNATGWFRGDLTTISSTGDDQLVYDAANSTNLPVPGAALTPGEINTGTNAQSPLVSLTSITPNAPVGSVTLTFNGPISQFLDQGGSEGVYVTDANGADIPGVDVIPTVAGLGTSTLTLTFTGSAVTGGKLPSGTYQLNFTGNSLIGNGRAVDAANAGTATGSNFEFEFTTVAPPPANADFDADEDVDGFDFLAWQRGVGKTGNATPADGDADDDQDVDGDDLVAWKDQYGDGSAAAAASATAVAPSLSTSFIPPNAWLELESLAATAPKGKPGRARGSSGGLDEVRPFPWSTLTTRRSFSSAAIDREGFGEQELEAEIAAADEALADWENLLTSAI